MSHQPNAPLDLDPSFKALLQDVDMSLQHHKHPQARTGHATPRELEIWPEETVDQEASDLEEYEGESRGSRKSPAASFGSRKIGAVVLPHELQESITTLISGPLFSISLPLYMFDFVACLAESDKRMIHTDAKRLFGTEDDGSELQWDVAYDVGYKSRKQAHRHAERDGTAFASVALPAHYSAISAVLEHVKQRLGPSWNIDTVYDWGAGTGSGLWAASHAFRTDTQEHPMSDSARLADSTVTNYVGIDKREGLVRIGKRLLQGIDSNDLNLSWQKSFHLTDELKGVKGGNTLALSGFLLSSINVPAQRKAVVKEMWESGAEVIIIIDHNTRAGFQNIIEAREYLLNMGRRETEDPDGDSQIKGAYIVAPCPHDGACPLYHSDSADLVCGSSQRLQRPPFVRKTKHSGKGHEDVGYSYVVIRRGTRPVKPSTEVGRVGEVGKWELASLDAKAAITELLLHDDHAQDAVAHTDQHSAVADLSTLISDLTSTATGVPGSDDVEEALRQEAFYWPRLVFPPLKRSGHVILDSCTPEGKIMRLTIPKSQGKQPYYDARKSDWGDLFPHAPKNAPQTRFQPVHAKREGGTTPTKGADIGKRGTKATVNPETSYSRLANEIKQHKNDIRKERRRKAADGF
ncbi:hypothetical protein EWM64_g4571 [Hericium alpestre]|uniref:Rsm22-domain-containing protein n=1 Tax=Hericium alpestre TaxID=135208 RepID=A0A4Y9ZX39_9AGAM|nr:hypothetical protein EWM64_g4571 [Hericium alpestre]